MMHRDPNMWYGTTIVSVRDENSVVVAGDGQVTLGHAVVKHTAKKIKRLYDSQVIAGIAGATADAMTLIERLEGKLDKYCGQLMRSCVEMAKDWRTDKYLRRLEAMMIVVDKDKSLIVTGNGDVLEMDDGLLAIGSGGNYALSAAKAMTKSNEIIKKSSKSKKANLLDAETIARESLLIAADICIHTNNSIMVEKIEK